MRKVIHVLLIFIIIFFVNFVFYFLSDDYRFFLKKIKDNDSIIYTDVKKINDDFPLDDIWESDIVDRNIEDNVEIVVTKEPEVKTQTFLWKIYKEVLYWFSKYDLKRIELNTNIFDITNEYPDNYYEYYWEDVTLYFFTSKKYTEVRDIFSVLEYELPIELNEVNNFWDRSFYINLNDDIKDKFVRIVMEIRWIVIWLKIKKESYNEIKQKLIELNTNTLETDKKEE